MKKASLLCGLIVLLAAFAFPVEMFADNYKSVVSVSTNQTADNRKFTKKRGAADTFYRDIILSNYEDVDYLDIKFKVTDSSDNVTELGYYDTDQAGNPSNIIDDFNGTPEKYWCSTKGDIYFKLSIKELRTKYTRCTLTLTFKEMGKDSNPYWYVSVKGTEISPDAVFNDAYYFISDLSDWKPRECFRFSPSRIREGGNLNEQYQNFNFRDFLLDEKHADKESITYWIATGDGKVVYRPYTDNYVLGKNAAYETKKGNIKLYESYGCLKNGDKAFKLNRGTAESYTIFINTQTNELEFIANDKYVGRGNISEKGYYLVGNFTQAEAHINIDPTKSDSRREMRKSWYKDGREHLEWNKTDEEADSVLFRATIPKPAEGWNQLYLMVFDKNDIETWSNLTSDIERWGKAIRPQCQWVKTSVGLDCTALHGGLVSRNEGGDGNGWSASQALNPQVDDSYTSYTFSMNITTSTYNLVFNKGMYIIGPAVTDQKDEEDYRDDDGWSIYDPDHQTKHALRMYYNRDSRCYTYRGKPEDGATTEDMLAKDEQPVHFEAGEKFAFVYNKDFTQTSFMGDRVSPKSLIKKNEKDEYVSTETDEYNLADNDYLNDNKDTQYVNYLRTGSASKKKYNEESKEIRACDFGLPTGNYFIRLYIRQDGNMQKIYYLLNRAYTFYRPYADKVEGYDTFKSFCDYHAVIVPDGIDILYVTEADLSTMTAKVAKYEPEVIDSKRILPANTPVILAQKTNSVNKTLEKPVISMEYYEEPNYKEGQDIPGNMLKGQISRKHIEMTEQIGGEYYTNYLFGYKKRNGSDKPATIGFYQPGDGNCSINTAYLQVKGKIPSSSASKGWTMAFDFGTTAIESVKEDNVMTDDSYYTLQGMKIARPTTKGIYIHNNKKIIIK